MDECFIQPMTYGKLSHFQCFVIEKKKKPQYICMKHIWKSICGLNFEL